MVVDKPGKFEIVFTPADGGAATRMEAFNFKDGGVIMGMYNTDEVRGVRSQRDVVGRVRFSCADWSSWPPAWLTSPLLQAKGERGATTPIRRRLGARVNRALPLFYQCYSR